MPQKEGQTEAIQRAIIHLKRINLVDQCKLLDLPVPEDGVLRLPVFENVVRLKLSDFQMELEPSGKPPRFSDQILLLHYLLCELPIVSNGELISFRNFPGGQFYWEPFRARTINPLLAKFGNDLDRLRTNLGRFRWEPFPLGDFGARIHALGKLDLILVYHLGDDEFPPEAEVLFDACAKRVFNAEDAAAMASRICLGLM